MCTCAGSAQSRIFAAGRDWLGLSSRVKAGQVWRGKDRHGKAPQDLAGLVVRGLVWLGRDRRGRHGHVVRSGYPLGNETRTQAVALNLAAMT